MPRRARSECRVTKSQKSQRTKPTKVRKDPRLTVRYKSAARSKPLKSSFMSKKRRKVRSAVRRVSWSPDVTQIERKPSHSTTVKRKSTVFYKINSDKTIFETGTLYATPLSANQCILKLHRRKQVVLYIILDHRHKTLVKMKTKQFRIFSVPGALNKVRVYIKCGDIQYDDPFMNLLWLNGKKHEMHFAFA